MDGLGNNTKKYAEMMLRRITADLDYLSSPAVQAMRVANAVGSQCDTAEHNALCSGAMKGEFRTAMVVGRDLRLRGVIL